MRNARQTCQICGVYYSASNNIGNFLACFPKNEQRCRIWLQITGRAKLLDLPRRILIQKKVCGKHFTPRDYNRTKTRLRRNAIPTQNLNLPPLDSKLIENWRFLSENETRRDHCKEKIFTETRREVRNILHDHMYYMRAWSSEKYVENIDERTGVSRVVSSTRDTDYPVDENSQQSKGDHPDDNYVSCTEVEYLEEDCHSDNSEDSAVIKLDNYTHLKKADIEDPLIMFDQDFKLTLDDVDFLFLSYARTFRSLAKQFQTMLKLDIAKLFARYEMKNNLNTDEGSKREEPPPPPVEPSPPAEISPQPALIRPQTVVKPSQLVFVKPPQTAVQPLQPNANPCPVKPSVFIPSKEDNKRIFRRIPVQAVPAGVIAKTLVSSPQVAQQAKPEETTKVVLVPPSIQVPHQQTVLPQTTQSSELGTNAAQKYIRVGNVPKTFNPTVKLDILNPKIFDPTVKLDVPNTDASISFQSESVQPPAPKVMKYYVPKKGPAYAIISKDSVKTRDESRDPDLDMEVTGQVHTETVFVPTDHVGYCDEETGHITTDDVSYCEEETGHSSDSSS